MWSLAGKFNSAWTSFLVSVVVLAVLIAILAWQPQDSISTSEPLLVYCAAGLKTPVAAAARQYEREYGVKVELNYGGSQTLLANLEVTKRGDLYLPADESYLPLARRKNLIAEVIPLADMAPVLAVRKGNPKKLRSLDDVLRTEARLAQANPDAAASGKLVRQALQMAGRWAAIQKRIVVEKPTVSDVANDIKLGAVDAGFVWDTTVKQYPDLEAVELPELKGLTAKVPLAVLHSSAHPTAALRFARYLAARDRGLQHFDRWGFKPVDGDPWAEMPELKLFAGAMLKPAVEETINAFEKREGVHVTRIYNGCGLLVSQMEAIARKNKGQLPDAYFACDVSFMKQVADLFLDAEDISTNQLVILVHKGNPHGIKTLKDLGAPGLRIGVGHEKNCALGALTKETLIRDRTYQRVKENIKVESATGDLLVNQLRTGSLDAVVAYISNAAGSADFVEAIPVDVPCAIAVQPVAVGRTTKYKYLTARLLEALKSPASQDRFQKQGFQWKASR
jgi:molybdenum ABC transporter molybdate-binding protein